MATAPQLANPFLPAAQPREVMDLRQAAGYLSISTDTLYRYAQHGVIPAFKLGNRWRFKRSLVDQWMRRQSMAVVQKAAPK